MPTPRPLILLVEDDQDLRETIIESLAIHGLPVTGVGTGLEFYQTLNLQTFAVAIVDLGLPDLNGYDLVAYLRENSTLKIIILTARTALADRVKGYSTGADLYLVKPVDIEELAAAIFSIVGRTAPSQTTTSVVPAVMSRPSTGPWKLRPLSLKRGMVSRTRSFPLQSSSPTERMPIFGSATPKRCRQ